MKMENGKEKYSIKILRHSPAPTLLYLLTILCVFVAGCATTRNERFQNVDDNVAVRDYGAALSILEDEETQAAVYPPTDQVLRYLDLGMLHFYAGNYPEAQRYLTDAEYLMEELFTSSITQEIGSFLLNDTVIDYAGEPYEELYTNIFKAIAALEENNFNTAYVEIRRLNDKLNLLEDKYSELAESYSTTENNEIDIQSGTSEFHNSALARYVSMLIYRADGNADSARIDAEQFASAYASQPAVYNFPALDLAPLLEDSELARLNPLVFTGRVPEKRSNLLFIHTEKDYVLIILQTEGDDGELYSEQIDAFFWPGIAPDYQFKFELPVLKRRGSEIQRIELLVDGVPQGELPLIESIENVAYEVYKLKEPIIYLKTIVRVILKGLVNKEVQRAATNEDALLGFIVGIFGDVATAASEVADLRAARYYPAFAYGGEFLVEPGVHNVSIVYYDGFNNILFRDNLGESEYQAGGLHVLQSYAPK